MDDMQFDHITIDRLHLSVRSYNALKRAGINTLEELLSVYREGKLLEIRNLGVKSYNEIKETIEEVINEEFQFYNVPKAEEDIEEYIVPEELEDIPIGKLKMSVRLCNGLVRSGFVTVGKVLRMTLDDVKTIRGIGAKTADELRTIIKVIKEEGMDCFDENKDKDESVDDRYKRTLDIDTVKKLKEDYGFKPVWLTEWYNVTRSRIQQIMKKRCNHGNWLNRVMTDDEKALLLELIEKKIVNIISEDGTKAYFLNNGNDDCAAIFVNDEEIKCFFMTMMPEDIQRRIKDERLDCFTLEELEIMSSGKKVSILKQEYFSPDNIFKFRQYARIRDMTAKEYCRFLTGMEYATLQSKITDEKIVEFLNAYYVNGRLMIPSTNSTQWFRSFISRNGYSIDEIAALYGFGEEQQLVDEIQRFGSIEEDMQKYEIQSEDFLEKLFAENPLIGNKMLSEKTKDQLYTITKGYIDRRLRKPQCTFLLKENMQIALAVITYAKEWDMDDESGFWRYITTQFGYRDEKTQLRSILCDCVLDAMLKNHRWFISSSTGYQYKSTIVVHALTTKRSWMFLYDFLFDFYKINMEWNYIEDDPIVARMVTDLRIKLIAGDEADDDNLEISTKVYSFQEGIRKLIIYRTGYAISLINRMLRRIDDIVNHSETPAELYVDVLCDEWIEGRLKNAGETKKRDHGSAAARNVAIDYTRIRPVYVLQNEKKIQISFPDIRLKKTEFEKVELRVFAGAINVDTRTLSFYGNEFGKTLNAFNVDLNMCLRRGDGSFNIRIVLFCDDEKIFDSEDILYRECLCFSHSKECDLKECGRGAYSVFSTKKNAFEFLGAEVSKIDTGSFWDSYFVRLEKGFLIKYDGQIAAFDKSDDEPSEEIRVVSPFSDTGIVYVKNGHKYNVVSKEASILLILKNHDDLRKCAVIMNSHKVDLNEFASKEDENGVIYTILLQTAADRICEFQIIDFERNRVILRDAIKMLPGFSVRFNRKFYFTDDDFRGAFVNVKSYQEVNHYEISSNDDMLSFPFEEGLVEISIPKITIRDCEGQKWRNTYSAWIKDIRQDAKMFLIAPAECDCVLRLGEIELAEESRGCYGFGNATLGCSGGTQSDWIDIVLSVSAENNYQEYVIGHISLVERFVGEVRFDYRDNTLYWNHGNGFLGNKSGSFKMKLFTLDGVREYPIKIYDEVVIENISLPLNEYKYKIVKESENIFLGDETLLCEGSLFIGDKNELRFYNSMIEITNITFEETDDLQSVDIKNTYIDQIEYQGIQFVDSEDRECPVYKGVMFFMGQSMKHHEFSFDENISEKGFHLYKINPVKIVFINEHTLSITNEDDDGIYCYRYFDKYALQNRYAITDREPNDRNRNTYYLADLYTYTKKGIK